MSRQTQESRVIEKLRMDGEVSRNWALRNYITRLAAIMLNLKNEGWEFEGKSVKTDWGTDYVYKLTKAKEQTLFS